MQPQAKLRKKTFTTGGKAIHQFKGFCILYPSPEMDVIA
jgi:hypothetical protein